MKSVTFPQANCELAKDQPEYETLHCFVEKKEIIEEVETNCVIHTIKKVVPYSFTCCLELSDEEIEEIIRTKRIWHTQMTFGDKFHPILMTTKNPFE